MFTKPASGGWADSTQTAKLTATGGVTGFHHGRSVAVDGDTVVVGATRGQTGGVYVFTKPASGVWADSTQTAKLNAYGGAASDEFAYSVAMDGDTVVAGASKHDDWAGSAYVFTKPVGGWVNSTQTAKLTASDGAANDRFGYSVAVDGDTVVVGAYGHYGSSRVMKKSAAAVLG